MKTKNNFIKFALIILGIIIMQSAFSQRWDGEKKSPIWDMWSVNFNAGLTSYFGDLSSYDPQFDKKLQYESGPALGMIVTKHLTNTFAVSGQVLFGSMHAGYSNISFSTEFLEYNLHARIDFVNLFNPHNPHKLAINGYAGIGQFFFSTLKVEFEDQNRFETIHNTGVPEFVYFVGAGIEYKATQKIGITIDLALRQCQNDRLDDYVKNDDFDYYSFLNIGITYNISSFVRTPVRNKAIFVYSGERLKNLND